VFQFPLDKVIAVACNTYEPPDGRKVVTIYCTINIGRREFKITGDSKR
jgi:hypothetical protein